MSAPSVPVIEARPYPSSATSIVFYWGPPTSDGGSPITKYTLACSAISFSQDISANQSAYEVTGLTAGTEYEFTITATNTNGTSPVATYISVQPGVIPFGPTLATASTLNESTALVTWNLSTIANEGAPKWFLITVYPSTTSMSSYEKSSYIFERARTFQVPSTNVYYRYLVQAINDTDYSIPFAFTTTIGFGIIIPSTTGAAFSPSSISGNALWLDAADGATITQATSSISQWNDKSGYGFNLTQTNSVARPLMSSNNYIRFTQGRHFDIPQTAMNNASAYTMLFQFIPVSTTNYILAKQHDFVNTYQILSMTSTVNSAGPTPGAMYWRTTNGGAVISTNNAVLPIGTSILMSLDFNGTSANFYRFGSSFGTHSNSGFVLANAPSVTNFKMGTYIVPATPGDVPPSSISHFQMGEFLFYSTIITPFERQEVEGYLAWKWGTQANLPVIHPFRSAAPTATSVFSPSSFAGLQLWLDAADTSSLTLSSASVTSWADKSGRGNTATGTVAPSYNSSTRYITFNGSSQYFTLPNGAIPFGDTEYSMFFVSYTTSTTSNQHIIFGGQETTPNALHMYYSAGTVGHAWWTNQFTAGTVTINSSLIIAATYQGTTRQTVINGGTPVTNSPAQARANPNTPNFIGRRGTNVEHLNGGIGEILIYNSSLSATDRQTVEGYLAWKWGLQSNLPATHPYRSNNPGPPIAVPSTFQPTSLAGLSFWIDATQISGASNNQALTAWNDLSPNAYTGGASNGPRYITSGINSLPIVRFNGTDQYINYGPSSLNIRTNPFHTFIVARYSTTNTTGALMAKSLFGGANPRYYLGKLDNNTNNYLYFNDPANIREMLNAFNSASTTMFGYYWDRNTMFSALNGSTVSTAAFSTTFDYNSAFSLLVGAYNNGTGGVPPGGFFFPGDMGEVLTYLSPLTPFDRQKVEGYLAWKWGLQSNLPAIHPFRPAAPTPNSFFSPSSFAGLALWLDGADPLGTGGIPADNSTITRWVDKSGAGNNANAAGITPTFVAASNAIFFPSSSYYSTTYSASLMNESLFVVFRRTASTPTNENTLLGTTGSGGRHFYTVHGSNNRLEANQYSQVMGSVGPVSSISINSTFIAELITTAGSQTTFVTGGNQGTTVSVNLTAGRTSLIAGCFSFLNNGNPVPSQYYTGYMYEILGFSTVLNTLDRQTVEGYLAWKWGLQATLPATHPYRNNNPGVSTNNRFAPTNLTGLQAWYDGADPFATGYAPPTGTSITSWADKSGNNRSSITGSVAATYRVSTTDQYLEFNGTNTRYNINGSFIANQYYTVFAVERLQAAPTAFIDGYFIGGTTLGTNANLVAGYIGAAGSTVRFTQYADTGAFIDSPVPAFTTAAAQPTRLFTLSQQTSNRSLILNGSNMSTTLNNTLLSGWAGAAIGFYGANGSYYNGHIKDILFYTGLMTPFDRQKVEGYLAWKWNLQGDLPASHPFRTAVPLTTSVFSPTSFSSLQLWIDAADATTVSTSVGTSTIVALRDKSANAYLFSNATGFTYNVTKFNTSYPSFYNPTEGAASHLGSNTTVAMSQPITAFYVGRMLSNVSGTSYLHDSPTSINRIALFSSNAQMFAGSVISPGSSSILLQNYVLAANFNTTNSAGFINGSTTAYVSGNIGTNNIVAGTGLLLANRLSLNESWNGHICEMLMYNRVLSTDDRQTVEGYLAWKWGLQGSLPTTHPYRNQNPASLSNPTPYFATNFNNGNDAAFVNYATSNLSTQTRTGSGFSYRPNISTLMYKESLTTSTNTVSFCASIYRTSTLSYAPIIFTRTPIASGLNMSSNGPTLGYHWNDIVGTYTYDTGYTVPLNTWVHVVLTISPTDARWYVNGALLNTFTNSHSPVPLSNLTIGVDPLQSLNRPFPGLIDNVAFYATTLTPSTISSIYASTLIV